MKVIKSIFRFISLLFLFAGSMPVFATIRGAPVYVKTVAQPNGVPKKYVRAFLKDRHVDFLSGRNCQRQQEQLFRVLKRCEPHSVKVVLEDMHKYDGKNAALRQGLGEWVWKKTISKEYYSNCADSSDYLFPYLSMDDLTQQCIARNIPCIDIEFRHLSNNYGTHDPHFCRPETVNENTAVYNFIKAAHEKNNYIMPANIWESIEYWMNNFRQLQQQNAADSPFNNKELDDIENLTTRLIDGLMYYHIDLMETENVEYGFFALGGAHIENFNFAGTNIDLDKYMAARGYTKAANNENTPFDQFKNTKENKTILDKWVVGNPRDIEADLAPFIPGGSYAFPTHQAQPNTIDFTADIFATQQKIAANKIAANSVAQSRKPATAKSRHANRPQLKKSATRTHKVKSQKRKPTAKAVRATIAKKAAAARVHRARKKVAARRGYRGKAARR